MGSSKKKRGKTRSSKANNDESNNEAPPPVSRRPNVLFEGWSGPGGTAQSYNRSRDSRRIKKAEKVSNRETGWSSARVGKRITKLDDMGTMKQHVAELYDRVNELETEEDATRLLNDTRQIFDACFVDVHDNRVICSDHLIRVYGFRAQCRLNRKAWDACIEDATECISMATLLKSAEGVSQESTEDIFKIELQALRMRSFAHSKKCEWSKAVKDQKAVCAIYRSFEPDMEGTGDSLRDAVRDALAFMVQERLEQQATRPHFTPKERFKIKDELGLGIYADSLYHCANCDKKASEEVNLKRCSRCHEIWYCGKPCQTIHWTDGGHRERCGKTSGTNTLLPESHRANIEEQIAFDGYAPVHHRTGPAIVVRDPDTGKLFESLTNQDVYFVDEGILRSAHAYATSNGGYGDTGLFEHMHT